MIWLGKYMQSSATISVGDTGIRSARKLQWQEKDQWLMIETTD